MVIALLSLGNNVFVDSLYEPALEPLSDHRESVAWHISDGPHSAAYFCKLGPNQVKAECLCLQTAATIFQYTHATADCAEPQPPVTKDMKTPVTPAQMQGGFLHPPWLGFIVSALHAVPTQFARSALAVRMQCNNLAIVP